MKPGYKQTEIGVIPEAWEVGTLKEAFLRLDAGVSVNSDEKATSEFYVLKTSAVRDGKVNINEAKPVVSSEYSRLKCPIVKGSIVISRMNTPAMVGECGYTDVDAPRTYLPDRLWQAEPLSPDYDYRWLNYLLNTEKYGSAVRATATGTSNSMKNIAKDRLLEIAVPKPSLAEQRRIAEALSDMDELIASLEKLIAKKKAIKQGAMQELLTGKRRLPGFSGEWVEDSFENLFDILPNNAYTRDQMSFGGNIKNVHYGDILTKYGAILDAERDAIPTIVKELEAKARQESAYIQSGDVIIADTAEDEIVGKAVEVVNVTGRILSGQHTFFCRPKVKFAPMFLGYYINSEGFHSQMRPFITGTKVSSISKASLNILKVQYPGMEEQEAIAGLLYDMDSVIKVIEERIAKARIIKQGMMQQLLTGRFRMWA